MYTNINSSSPLKHDFPMLDGAMRLARRGQPVIVTPFTLSGAMAPVTIAGAVAQQTAEALCVDRAAADASGRARRWSTARSPPTST